MRLPIDSKVMEREKFTVSIGSLSGLRGVAEEVIARLDGRSVVAFRAPMGAGKTTLIAEIVAALGSEDNVTSPTFALVNQYDTSDGHSIYHFDFYRIDRVEEAFDMGYEEYFFSGELCLIEWPEKIEELLPDDVMTVTIHIDSEDGRTFEIY